PDLRAAKPHESDASMLGVCGGIAVVGTDVVGAVVGVSPTSPEPDCAALASLPATSAAPLPAPSPCASAEPSMFSSEGAPAFPSVALAELPSAAFPPAGPGALSSVAVVAGAVAPASTSSGGSGSMGEGTQRPGSANECGGPLTS